MSMGKGSKQRPNSTTSAHFNASWARIFGKPRTFDSEGDMYEAITGQRSKVLDDAVKPISPRD